MTDHETGGTSTIQLGSFNLSSGINHAANGTSTITVFCNAAFMERLSTIHISASGNGFIFPPVSVRDVGDIGIDEIHFESIFAGHKTTPHIVTLRNNTETPVNLTLTPKVTYNQKGSAIDTYLSTYLSRDGNNYSQSLALEIPANDSLDFYMYYSPPSTSKIGEKEWEVSHRSEELGNALLPSNYFYAMPIIITGHDVVEEDKYVRIKLEYTPTLMSPDFKDIHFIMSDGTLLEGFKNSINGEAAYYSILLPETPGNGETLTIYALTGNSLEPLYYSEFLDSPHTTEVPLPPEQEIWALNPPLFSEYAPNPTKASLAANRIIVHEGGYYTRGTVLSNETWPLPFKMTGYLDFRATAGGLIFGFIDNDNYYHLRHIHTASSKVLNLYEKRNGTITLLHSTPTIKWGGLTSGYTPYPFELLVTEHNIYMTWNNLVQIDFDYELQFFGTGFGAYGAAANEVGWDAHHYFGDNLNVVCPKTGYANATVTLGDWSFYIILSCKGGILYRSQDLPELEAEISYGCRIGGDYYE